MQLPCMFLSYITTPVKSKDRLAIISFRQVGNVTRPAAMPHLMTYEQYFREIFAAYTEMCPIHSARLGTFNNDKPKFFSAIITVATSYIKMY